MVTDIFTIYTLKHVWNMDFDFRVRRVDIRLLLIQVKFIRDTHFIIMHFETPTKKTNRNSNWSSLKFIWKILDYTNYVLLLLWYSEDCLVNIYTEMAFIVLKSSKRAKSSVHLNIFSRYDMQKVWKDLPLQWICLMYSNGFNNSYNLNTFNINCM